MRQKQAFDDRAVIWQIQRLSGTLEATLESRCAEMADRLADRLAESERRWVHALDSAMNHRQASAVNHSPSSSHATVVALQERLGALEMRCNSEMDILGQRLDTLVYESTTRSRFDFEGMEQRLQESLRTWVAGFEREVRHRLETLGGHFDKALNDGLMANREEMEALSADLDTRWEQQLHRLVEQSASFRLHLCQGVQERVQEPCGLQEPVQGQGQSDLLSARQGHCQSSILIEGVPPPPWAPSEDKPPTPTYPYLAPPEDDDDDIPRSPREKDTRAVSRDLQAPELPPVAPQELEVERFVGIEGGALGAEHGNWEVMAANLHAELAAQREELRSLSTVQTRLDEQLDVCAELGQTISKDILRGDEANLHSPAAREPVPIPWESLAALREQDTASYEPVAAPREPIAVPREPIALPHEPDAVYPDSVSRGSGQERLSAQYVVLSKPLHRTTDLDLARGRNAGAP